MANPSVDLRLVRNIGVIAHIDAGKTTTTEHLLYYAGDKHKLGGVDEGTTETDYDQEEQERGITIYSACVPFQWLGHTINLIDTPGHVDFTAEVERSLRVLDGCVCVFDAQKGVEAQSETVWRQANKYAVPRLVFVNKMDVVGANFANCLEQIRDRLAGVPLPIVIPIGAGSIKETNTPFVGVIDVLAMKALYFEAADHGRDRSRGGDSARESGRSEEVSRRAVRCPHPARRPGPHYLGIPRRQGSPDRRRARAHPRTDDQDASAAGAFRFRPGTCGYSAVARRDLPLLAEPARSPAGHRHQPQEREGREAQAGLQGAVLRRWSSK